MTPTNRREFIQQASVAGAALCGFPFDVGTAPSRQKAGPPLDPAAIREFSSKVAGRLITADSSDYESSRIVFNRAFDQRPALIVRCVGASDVAHALEFAQTHNLPLAVRGGGHSRAGFGVCDGGLVVDLSEMNRVEVNVAGRVARAGAGALVRDLDQATQHFGLATTSGGCPTVGIAGLKLVTVDGREVEASHRSNTDLFWAMRGGGGNFGVVTALEYKVYPLTDVLAGTLTYPIGRIPDLLHAFVKFAAAAPDEMNVVGIVSPSEHGARFHMLVCHCGDPQQGNELLKPLRAFKPQDDKIRVASYLETQTTINPYSPGAHFQTNLILPQLSSTAIATITAATSDAPPNTRVFIVPIYGAITRVKVDETAFPLRYPGYELDIMGRWNNPADKADALQWVKSLRDKLRPFARGAYSNQLGETSEELVRTAYGPNYARLSEIKKKYDPQNVLRLNQNIKPV